MPRGRHRHAPPLHRILGPAVIAAAALVSAGGAWLAGDPGDTAALVLRGLTAVAAGCAVTGAVLLRRWDRAAGRRVGELRARHASTEWRAEERQAELEGELEEARAARDGMARKVREKRAELARMRSEHAELLRRYASSEAERAGTLSTRRELEAAAPAKELSAGAADHRETSGAPTALTYRRAGEALVNLNRSLARQQMELTRARARDRLVPAPRPDLRTTPAAAVVPPHGTGPGPDGAHRRAPESPAAGGGREQRPFDFFGPGPAQGRKDSGDGVRADEPAGGAHRS